MADPAVALSDYAAAIALVRQSHLNSAANIIERRVAELEAALRTIDRCGKGCAECRERARRALASAEQRG